MLCKTYTSEAFPFIIGQIFTIQFLFLAFFLHYIHTAREMEEFLTIGAFRERVGFFWRFSADSTGLFGEVGDVKVRIVGDVFKTDGHFGKAQWGFWVAEFVDGMLLGFKGVPRELFIDDFSQVVVLKNDDN